MTNNQVLFPFKKYELNNKDRKHINNWLRALNTKGLKQSDSEVKISIDDVHEFVTEIPVRKTRDMKVITSEGWEFSVNSEGEVYGSDFGFGEVAKISSDRLSTFKYGPTGLTCVCCGLKGTHYRKRMSVNGKQKNFHLNLFASISGGIEIQLTKDHIIPKSSGGKNHVSNYVTSCSTCNQAKGNIEATWDEIKQMIINDQIPRKNRGNIDYNRVKAAVMDKATFV